MMPDLGAYAVPVLTAYGASLVLLAGIVGISLWRGARVRDALREIEARQNPAGGPSARFATSPAPDVTPIAQAEAPGRTPETRTHG